MSDRFLILQCILLSCGSLAAQDSVHLRNAEPREWAEFPEIADARELSHIFSVTDPTRPLTLQLNQYNVKQAWDILVNGTAVGQLHRNENPITALFSIQTDALRQGQNELLIRTRAKHPDDIRISKIRFRDGFPDTILNKTQLSVRVTNPAGNLLPCRVTVIRDGHLMTLGAASDETMAVRPGVIYCRGEAKFSLPAGTWTIVAGRGPEYSIHRMTVTTTAEQPTVLRLQLQRQVDTPGLVACDTHVHTLTHSGHGDSTVRERMLTLAGECVELPIATDHNRHIDYRSVAEDMQLSRWFTPVIGNEVTTKIGHFNIFPVASADTPVPDHTPEHWPQIFQNIFQTDGTRVAILNHARDLHSGYRPFGAKHHLAVTGRNLDGWNLRANAMEVINSAAQQTDMMQLIHDWMALQNAGRPLTPVGCSDSHDVARHFVAQARTYIRCDDSDAGRINVDSAVTAFLQGRVLVSCGLIADMRLNATAGPGEMVSTSEPVTAEVLIHGPDWIQADRVALYVNGQLFAERKLSAEARTRAGLKERIIFCLPRAKHDYFVAAVVTGPGVEDLWWPIARPYQPNSPEWTPQMMGLTGAVQVDADGNGRFECARDLAVRLHRAAQNQISNAMAAAAEHDAAVQLHLADLYYQADRDLFFNSILPAVRETAMKDSFETFAEAARASERAVAMPE